MQSLEGRASTQCHGNVYSIGKLGAWKWLPCMRTWARTQTRRQYAEKKLEIDGTVNCQTRQLSGSTKAELRDLPQAAYTLTVNSMRAQLQQCCGFESV